MNSNPHNPFSSDLTPSDALFNFQDIISSNLTPLESLEYPSDDFNFRLNIRESGKKSFPSLQEELESPSLGTKRNRIYTSYDIYGNELNLEKDVFTFDSEEENEGLAQRFGFGGEAEDLDQENKENKDPESNLITPLKKRVARIENGLMGSSNYSRRSPLVDITPPVLKKKNSNCSDNYGIGVNTMDFYMKTNLFINRECLCIHHNKRRE